jgi:hypothetical protein
MLRNFKDAEMNDVTVREIPPGRITFVVEENMVTANEPRFQECGLTLDVCGARMVAEELIRFASRCDVEKS